MRNRSSGRTGARALQDVPRLEHLIEQIQRERALRLDILRLPDMVPRKFKRRPRPKTAIIAHAAQAAIEVQTWLEERPETEVAP